MRPGLGTFRLPGPRLEFVDARGGPEIDQLREHVGEDEGERQAVEVDLEVDFG